MVPHEVEVVRTEFPGNAKGEDRLGEGEAGSRGQTGVSRYGGGPF